ncbi:uncharacterized protein LOC121871210 [Homarus americanus]|nr:uncharacterized protein LOC121871210 [Homarus americanus]
MAYLSEMFEVSDSSDDTYDPDDYSDSDEYSYPLSCSSTDMLGEGSGEGRYFLRPRPQKPPQNNPLLVVETPSTFSRIVQYLEAYNRRKSRSRVWQLSLSRLTQRFDTRGAAKPSNTAHGAASTSATILGEPSTSATVLGETSTSATILGEPSTSATVLRKPNTTATILGGSNY